MRWGVTAREALLADGVPADVEFRTGADADPGWIHYRQEDGDVYFVCNPSAATCSFEAVFRVGGRQPELWDPVTAVIRPAAAFRQEGGRTVVPLALPAYGSVFVVWRRPIDSGRDGTAKGNGEVARTLQTVEGPWDVSFDPAWGGPRSVSFDRLVDWAERPEPGIRHYSGKAVYRATFDWAGPVPAPGVGLALGEIADAGLARASLNGRDVGVLWCPPFRADVSGVLRAGRNELQVEVINSWRNRLVGERGQPQEKRLTRTNIAIRPEWKLVRSGLLGPVQLVAVEPAP